MPSLKYSGYSLKILILTNIDIHKPEQVGKKKIIIILNPDLYHSEKILCDRTTRGVGVYDCDFDVYRRDVKTDERIRYRTTLVIDNSANIYANDQSNSEH